MREGDRDKFKILAERRVNNAIKCIKLVGNLANKSNYYYTDADIKKIFGVLDATVSDCRTRFDFASKQEDQKFTLD